MLIEKLWCWLRQRVLRLHPWADEQINSFNGQEVALKVIPEDSEFLMRWRYGDIKRFLEVDRICSEAASSD